MTTMTIHRTALDAKIAARNLVNTAAVRLTPPMLEALKPFVGQKIQNADGHLSKKIKAALPDIGHDASAHGLSAVELNGWYSAGGGYSLTAHLKTCQSAAGRSVNGQPSDYQSAHYEECTVYLGELRDGILTKLAEPQDRRTDYTAAQIITLRARLADAQRVVSGIESELAGFGTYDR